MSVSNVFVPNLDTVYCDTLICNHLNTCGFTFSGGNIVASNILATVSLSSSGTTTVDTLVAAGNITSLSTILGDTINANFINAANSITSSGTLNSNTLNVYSISGSTNINNILLQKSGNIAEVNTSYVWPDNISENIVNGTFIEYGQSATNFTLRLPSTSGIYSAFPDMFFGASFHLNLVNQNTSGTLTLVNSSDGTFITGTLPIVVSPSLFSGSQVSRLVTCIAGNFNQIVAL